MEEAKFFQNLLNERNMEESSIDHSRTVVPVSKNNIIQDKIANIFLKIKEIPLKFGFKDMMRSFFCPNERIKTIKRQRKTGISNIFSQIDIKYILKKFSEIDKLKMLFLDEDQYPLFEYFPKPVILKNANIQLNYSRHMKMSASRSPRKSITNEIFNFQNDYVMKARMVQRAYHKIIQKNNEMTNLDRKMIDLLDDNIIKMLKKSERKQCVFHGKKKSLN